MFRRNRNLAVIVFLLLLASGVVFAGVEATRLFSPSGWVAHRWLLWNLFLAWLPLLFALAASRMSLPLALLPAVFWLLFLPNAPYIVTDLIHVGRLDRQTPALLDLLLIGIAALTGLCLGLLSLLLMQIRAERRIGRSAARLFALGCLLLAAVGVYLGRVQRWNSWDLLSRPADLVSSILPRLLDPLSHPLMLGGIGLFALASLVCYLPFYRLLARRLRDQSSAG